MPQVRVEAADPIMVKAETGNFEGSHNEIEAKDLSIVNISFKLSLSERRTTTKSYAIRQWS